VTPDPLLAWRRAYRPGVGIRMSPHFYTGDEELDAAFAAIDEIRTGAWRRWVDRPADVT
jgi:selenocysteine lyase/cysteine desulfurase